MPKDEGKTISEELESVELDNTDDYFEQVLKDENLKPPTDDDAGDDDKTSTDTSDKKVVDEPEVKKEEETVESLKAEIARLEKEAKGRLGDVVKSRQEKASIKAELAQLSSAVTDLLNKAKADTKIPPEVKKVPLEDTKKDIEFKDDDSAFVDLTEVKEKIEAETKDTKAEIAALKAKQAAADAEKEFNEVVAGVIETDKETLSPAYDDLKDMYKDLNDAVRAMQLRTGIMDENGGITQDAALDALSGSEEEQLFQDKHPGIDYIRIARAFNTLVDFKGSLRHIAGIKEYGKAKESTDQTLDEKLETAKKKPAGLGATENQASGNVDLLERLASMDYSEIENLSDAEAAKVEALLEKQALKGE